MGLTNSSTGNTLLKNSFNTNSSYYTVALAGNPNVRKKHYF